MSDVNRVKRIEIYARIAQIVDKITDNDALQAEIRGEKPKEPDVSGQSEEYAADFGGMSI